MGIRTKKEIYPQTMGIASGETEFWKQRKIVTDQRNRTGKELAFTRLVFMTVD